MSPLDSSGSDHPVEMVQINNISDRFALFRVEVNMHLKREPACSLKKINKQPVCRTLIKRLTD